MDLTLVTQAFIANLNTDAANLAEKVDATAKADLAELSGRVQAAIDGARARFLSKLSAHESKLDHVIDIKTPGPAHFDADPDHGGPHELNLPPGYWNTRAFRVSTHVIHWTFTDITGSLNLYTPAQPQS
jgi:hypothetical protein